jgi:hypothetical protein
MKNINKMSYLTHLKKTKMHYKNRWVVKYDKDDFIREVKLVYNPDEYRGMKKAKRLHTQKGLIKILEKDKQKRLK